MIEHAGTCSIYNSAATELRFSHGDGGYVYDDENRRYIDFVLGFGPVVLGHNNSEFNSSLTSYIKNGIHMPSYTSHHNEYLDSLIKNSEESVAFFKTSSESVSSALRIAAQVNGKMRYIRCGYIGWHDAQIANTCSWHEYLDSPLRNNVRFTEGFRGATGDERVYNWADLKLESLRRIVNTDSNVGAFIIDMFQLHFMAPATLSEAIQLCKKHNIIIILDETKTAGRVSERGVHCLYNFDYDLLVLGKALANGAPFSLLIGQSEIMKHAREARITGTFSKELLGLWCAIATRDIMCKSNGYEELSSIGNEICTHVNSVINKEHANEYVKCLPVFNSSMLDFRFSTKIVAQKDLREKFRRLLVDEGILILQGHPWFICLAHKELDLDSLDVKFSIAIKRWVAFLK